MQQFALELVMVLEARESHQHEQETFKQAVLSANPEKYLPLLYPETFTQHIDAETLGTEELMEGTGKWEMPDEMDPREAEQLMNEVLRHPIGTMSLTDVDEFE